MRRTGAALLVGLVAMFALAMTMVAAPQAVAGHNSAAGDAKGVTDGWIDGETVTFFYPKAFFCKEPPTSGATSNCELGEEAAVAPRAGETIPTLYVMTPLGFRPDESTLQCATVGSCINHPSTIDVIGVTEPSVWAQVAEGKSLDRVRELQAAGVGITGDIPTNLYLFFSVQD